MRPGGWPGASLKPGLIFDNKWSDISSFCIVHKKTGSKIKCLMACVTKYWSTRFLLVNHYVLVVF